jgi:hypothetical protein
MFYTFLEKASESGYDVLVEMKESCQRYRGRIMEVSKEAFTLFHSGSEGGVLWLLSLSEVSSCGLLLPGPEPEALGIFSAPKTVSESIKPEKHI